MQGPRSLKDVLSGLIFVGLGLAFGIAAAGYELGTALRMGPGYFPLVLAGVLGVLGLAIVAKGLLGGERGELGRVPWRATVLILGAFVVFGATVRGLGLAPALFVAAFASALASRSNSPLAALALAASLTLFCLLIFSWGLGVPVPVLGPWLRF
jgi:hypothetical protein